MSRRRIGKVNGALAMLVVVLGCWAVGGWSTGLTPVREDALPDVSGLAWIEGTAFLAVHDAKRPEEDDRPRVSIVRTPRSGGALSWTPLDVDWPSGSGPSHDLESIARVPGTSTYLLAESGNGGSPYQRIFVTELAGTTLSVREAAEWPVPVFDVEGTAVVRIGEQLYFVFAERAHGASSTQLRWARLSLGPLELHDLRTAEFENPMQGSDTRVVSAIEIDSEGRVYVATTCDPGRDGGPFWSAVWEIGTFGSGSGDGARLVLTDEPVSTATLDGLKVESLAMAGTGTEKRLVLGTDDEDFGGVLRRLP